MMHGELDSFHRGLKAKVEELHAANAALAARLASLAEAGAGYSQQTMDAMVKERSELQARLAELRLFVLMHDKRLLEEFDEFGLSNADSASTGESVKP